MCVFVCVHARKATDQSDKQQYMQCHTEPLMSFPIPSSHYGLTSADEINTEIMLKLVWR